MKKIPDEEIKNIEFNILKYIDDICIKNNIVYSLTYGTLLGAIRHKGFIPWDDDIDICMDRKNFNKFVEACKLDNSNIYELLWIDTNKKYTLPLPKVIDKTTVLTQNTQNEKMKLGVYVDVFIFDKIPKDDSKRKKFINKLELYQRFWGYSQNKYVWRDHSIKSCIRFIVYCIFHLINPRFFSGLLNKAAQKYDKEENFEFLGSMVYSVIRNKGYFNKYFFEETKKVEFENRMFPITRYYDELLTICYGDYMKYPPIEKQVSNHDFSAFYRDIIE